MEEKNIHQHSIRFPDALFRWIEDHAKKERRSINAQVIWMLQQLYDQEKQEKRENK